MMPIISNERLGMLVNSHPITRKHNAAGCTSRGSEEQDERVWILWKTESYQGHMHGRPKRGHGGRRFSSSQPQAHVSEASHTWQPSETKSSKGLSNEEMQTRRHLVARLDLNLLPQLLLLLHLILHTQVYHVHMLIQPNAHLTSLMIHGFLIPEPLIIWLVVLKILYLCFASR